MIIEIGQRNGTDTRQQRNNSRGNYSVTYGASLVDLAERRRAQANQLYRDDYATSSRHFTLLGFQRVNQLIVNIATGDHGAVGTLLSVIQPWIERTHQRIASQVFLGEDIDVEGCEDAQIDTFMQLIGTAQAGGIQGWSRFSVHFQQKLRRRYENLKQDNENLPTISLNEKIPYQHLHSHLWEDDPKEMHAMNDPTRVSRHETISSPTRQEVVSEVMALQCTERIEKVLLTLTYREREILKLRFGLGDGYTYTLDEVGEIFKITGGRVRMIEAKAIRKLQHPVRSRQLEGFVEGIGKRPLMLLWEQQTVEANEEQRKVNNRILWEIEDDLVAQKQVILNLLKCGEADREYVPATTIFQRTGVPEHLIYALCDTEWTFIDHLSEVLDERVIARLKAGLPQLGLPTRKIYEFEDAIEALEDIMGRFTEMGGKPIKEQHRAY